jgi:predicted Zn finger-like uncharacterized protein
LHRCYNVNEVVGTCDDGWFAMRLICPNCDAEYEVDGSVIPETGRDVQCSNCGHAWFQLSPEVEAEMAAEEALFDAPPAEVVPDAASAGRSLDETVLAVLREEAEREVSARQSEGIETQVEMGLQAGNSAEDATAARIARLKGLDMARGAAKPQTRREMLPEIDAINSTLRASSETRAGAAAAVSATMEPVRARRGGFRNGFVLIVLLAAIGMAAYALAPKIAAQMPATAGAMQAYVAAVDAGRVGFDGLLKSAIGFLRGLAGGSA